MKREEQGRKTQVPTILLTVPGRPEMTLRIQQHASTQGGKEEMGEREGQGGTGRREEEEGRMDGVTRV